MAAMDAMDAEGGTASATSPRSQRARDMSAPRQAALWDWACNHCVVVVDTTGELGGFWAMRSWPETPKEGPRDCQRCNTHILT